MDGFRKPDRGGRVRFRTYLFLDADQTVESLSELEGGIIEELRSISEEESSNGKGLKGNIGFGPV